MLKSPTSSGVSDLIEHEEIIYADCNIFILYTYYHYNLSCLVVWDIDQRGKE